MYRKTGGGTETGLGILGTATGSTDNEITNKSSIQFNVTDLKPTYTNLTMSIGSIQTEEGFLIFGSNTAGDPGTLLMSYTDTIGPPTTDTFAIPDFSAYDYFTVSATPIQPDFTSSDVLDPGRVDHCARRAHPRRYLALRLRAAWYGRVEKVQEDLTSHSFPPTNQGRVNQDSAFFAPSGPAI